MQNLRRCSRAAVSGQQKLQRPFATSIPDGLPVTFQDISRAVFNIRHGVKRPTCVKASEKLEKHVGMNLYLKRELEHHTGSFKERGARNTLALLGEQEKKKGCIAASAGNHALAMAWHGRDLGIPVTLVMPTVAPLTKVSGVRQYGGNVVIAGEHIGEAKDHALSQPEFEGMTYINGYDHPHIIAGAGTMGTEILDDLPDVDVVVVPLGGGGLIAGTALAIKTLRPHVQVIGVEPEFCASYLCALAAGKPVAAPVQATLADGLAVPVVGGNAFEVARHTVDKCVTVNERQIAIAILRLAEMEKTVVEGGGATGLAAILPGGPLHEELQGKNVVIPLCGGNIDITVLGRVIDRGLAADSRLIRFVATVSDRPGGIARLTEAIAEAGASVKDFQHERAWVHSSLSQVQVRCVVETTGVEQTQNLKASLEEKEYPLVWGAATQDPETGLKADPTLPFSWDKWAKMDVPSSTGIVKPLLAAVPPGGLPRMAACGWISVAAADAMGVALAVFKGVDSFEDFTAKPGSNDVKAVSKAAAAMGISVGMDGEEALKILESTPATDAEKAAGGSSAKPSSWLDNLLATPLPSHNVFDGWTVAELGESTGLPKPLLVAVPPGGQPRMAACGWVDPATADALGVSLLVYKGVGSLQDFVVEAGPTSNVVKVASKAAQDLGLSEGAAGESALVKLAA